MRNLLLVLIPAILLGCNQKQTIIAVAENSATKTEVQQAEAHMFDAIERNDPNFFNKEIRDSYITINADGVMADKKGTIADSMRRKAFIGIDHKLSDTITRVFGNIGIRTGRAQFLSLGKPVAEIFYTAIFRKQDGKWLFEGWQGTLSKNSPRVAMN